MSISRTRILVNDHSGHPFQIQLSRELASREYDVLHTYSASFQTPKGCINKREHDPDNFRIKGIELAEPFQKYSYIRRRFQEREYGRLLYSVIKRFEPQIIISSNTPLDAQSLILSASKAMKSKFIYWVQDIYSIGMKKVLSQRYSHLGRLISIYYSFIEQRQIKNSDAVVLITEDFIPLMKSWSVEASKYRVIRNWAPISELPILPKVNDWSLRYKLQNKFCIVYSGTLGIKHNPNLLLKIAHHYKNDNNIKIIVVSEGLGAEYIKTQKNNSNLNNLTIMEYQPYELLPSVLSTADILLAVLEPEAGTFSVPSKVLTYLCFKRPLVLAVPKENLAARIVQQIDAGMVVSPKDINSIILGIDKLVSNPSLRREMGNNAYRYAKENFDISLIASSFQKIIGEISAEEA